jgi:hypothetical protein
MDDQSYRLKTKLNDYHRQTATRLMIESKLPYCRSAVQADVGRLAEHTPAVGVGGVLTGVIVGVGALFGLKSLASVPLGFAIGYQGYRVVGERTFR